MRPVTTLMSGVSLLGVLLASGAEAFAADAGAWQESFARDERQSGGATLRYRL